MDSRTSGTLAPSLKRIARDAAFGGAAEEPQQGALSQGPPLSLRYDLARSLGGPRSANALIHGDNLAVLQALKASHTGQVQCIYLDPPYNTGRQFAEYTDRRSETDWITFMRSRIRALHPLLSESGTLFAEIDDTELGSLLQLLDEEFGRDNRVSLVTIVRSAATGHKARNRGPVNVTDFLLVYAKHRPSWRCKALVRPRETYDAAYNTFLDNREDPPEDWRFLPLGKKFALEAGFPDAHAARKAKGSGYKAALTAFALRHARSVVRFAQPRFEAISHDAQRLVEKSKSNPTATFVLPRSKHPPMFLRGGNRILFLSDKVQTTDDGLTLVEPLTNVWDDIPFQGIAREGGVTFSRNKKPEKLLARILDMATEPGDLVLDPFLGSGTTAAVAHKLGRRWLGVENGPHIDTLCLPRLRSVIDGVDETGVSRVVGWQGGGEFAVYTL